MWGGVVGSIRVGATEERGAAVFGVSAAGLIIVISDEPDMVLIDGEAFHDTDEGDAGAVAPFGVVFEAREVEFGFDALGLGIDLQHGAAFAAEDIESVIVP